MYGSDSIVHAAVRTHRNEGGLGWNHLFDEVVSDTEGSDPAMSYSLKLCWPVLLLRSLGVIIGLGY